MLEIYFQVWVELYINLLIMNADDINLSQSIGDNS